MTQYAPQVVEVAREAVPPRVTKTFMVSAWAELDRVRVQKMHFKVTMTGVQGSQRPDSLTIDGEPATLQSVAGLFIWSRDGGSFNLVSEQLADGAGA